jgi:hypothetical protein
MVSRNKWQDIGFNIWTRRLKILSEMDKKKAADDTEPGPAPSRAVDRFGFIKPEQSNSPDGIPKGKSIHERERYDLSCKICIVRMCGLYDILRSLYLLVSTNLIC